MQTNSPEVRDIGRFIRTLRESAPASEFPQLPNRRRHKPHLTQSDLAELVAVSTVVISQVEQGRYPNLSQSLLQRIVAALGLTQQQAAYLLGLQRPRADHQKQAEPAPEWVVTTINLTSHPVTVVNPALDIVGYNAANLRLFGQLRAATISRPNSAASVFTVPAVRDYIQDWPAIAASTVSSLRMSFALFPDWRNHIEELALKLRQTEPLFGELWDRDDPLAPQNLEQVMHHPQLGDIHLLQVLTDLVEAPGLTKIELIPADEESARKIREANIE